MPESDIIDTAKRVYKRVQWIRHISRRGHRVKLDKHDDHNVGDMNGDGAETAVTPSAVSSVPSPAVSLNGFQRRFLSQIGMDPVLSIGMTYTGHLSVSLPISLGSNDTIDTDFIEAQLAHAFCHVLQHSRGHFSGYFSSTMTLDELTARVAAVEGECLHVGAEYMSSYTSTRWPIVLYDPSFIGARLRQSKNGRLSLLNTLKSLGYIYYHRHRDRHRWRKLNYLYITPPTSTMNLLYPGLGRSVVKSAMIYRPIAQLINYNFLGTDRIGPAVLYQLIASKLGNERAKQILSGWKTDLIAGFEAPGPLFPAPIDEALRPVSFLHRSEWRTPAEARSFSDAMSFVCQSADCLVKIENQSVVWAYGLPAPLATAAAKVALQTWDSPSTGKKSWRRRRRRKGRKRRKHKQRS